MKRISVLVFVVIFLLNSYVSATELVGPKAYGMGGAFTAVADDASSLYWNPAGLTRSGFIGAEVSFGFSTSSIDDVLDFAKSFQTGDVMSIINAEKFDGRLTGFAGANLKNFSGGIIVNETLRFDPTNLLSYRYSEMIGNIGLGVDLTRPIFNLGRLSLGTNFKIIQRDEYQYIYENGQFVQVNELDPIKDQELGLDIGALARFTDMVNISLVARNMKLTLKEDNKTSLKINMPEAITVGAALKVPFPLNATIAADLEHNFGYTDPVGNEFKPVDVLHIGLEKKLFFNLLALRLGAYGPFQTTDRAFQDKITYTAGLGLNILALHANAAVGVSDDFADLNATLSASMKF